MKSTCVVVGAGLVGLCTAWELQSRGHQTVLLDRNPDVAGGTSYANGGLLTPSMSDPWNAPGAWRHLLSSMFDPAAALKLRWAAFPGVIPWGIGFIANSRKDRHRRSTEASFVLARCSVELTRQLADDLDLSFELNRGGTIKIFRDHASLASSLDVSRTLSAHGLTYRQVSPAEAVSLEPALVSIEREIAGGIFYPEDMSGDARKFCQALVRRYLAAGGGHRPGAVVERIVLRAGRPAGVALASGEVVETDRVIVAAGDGSPALLRERGVRLPIYPAKGYTLTARLPTGTGSVLPGKPIVDDVLHAAVTPLGDRIRVAGTAEFIGWNTVATPQRTDGLIRMFDRIYPHLRSEIDWSTAEAWAGLRPMSNDGLPMIGPAGMDGLYVNSGHGHLGWTCAVGSAVLLADVVEGRPTRIDASRYGVDRRR